MTERLFRGIVLSCAVLLLAASVLPPSLSAAAPAEELPRPSYANSVIVSIEHSPLDAKAGVFYWMPAPGFLGTHVLNFAVTDGKRRSRPVTVTISIRGSLPILPYKR
jgi:hypothetical protein